MRETRRGAAATQRAGGTHALSARCASSPRVSTTTARPEELAPLALHRLDAMAVVAVKENGIARAGTRGAPAARSRTDARRPAVKGARTTRDRERVAGPRPVASSCPSGRGAAAAGPNVEDISSDGERFRLFPPRPAAEIDDDFLELIRALEREFDRHMERTKVAGKVGRAILIHVTTGGPRRAEASMDELAELATSSDLQIVERVSSAASRSTRAP